MKTFTFSIALLSLLLFSSFSTSTSQEEEILKFTLEMEKMNYSGCLRKKAEGLVSVTNRMPATKPNPASSS
jgi:hypothetical protein